MLKIISYLLIIPLLIFSFFSCHEKNKEYEQEKASQFSYYNVSEMENSSSLYATPTGSEGMVLIFYDHECEACVLILDELENLESLNSLISQQKISILAIDINPDKMSWSNNMDFIPKNWSMGWISDNIVEEVGYPLPTSPTFYILDSDYRFIEKDIPLDNLIVYLNNMINFN